MSFFGGANGFTVNLSRWPKGVGGLVANRLGFIGDSIMQANHSMSAAAYSLGQGQGEVNWAQAFYPYFEIDTWFDGDVPTRQFTGMNAGISGDKTSDVLLRMSPLRARRPGVVLFAVGINDIINNVSAATAFANIQAGVEYYLAGGTKVILATVRPVATSSIPDADARLTALTTLNTSIRNYAAATANVELWDAYAAYDNGSGRPISGTLSDGLHPNRTGAMLAGRSLATVIATVIDTTTSNIPTGTSLATNPLMSGSAGTEGTRASGDTASDWRVAASGTGTSTAVCSKNGSDKQVITVTPQAAGQGAEYFVLTRAVGGVAVTPGNWIKLYTRVKLSAWDGWRNIYQHAPNVCAGLAGPVATAVIDAPGELTLDIIAPPHLVTSGITSISPLLAIGIDGTKVGGSGVATIEHFGFYEVPDPRPSH